MGLSCVFSLHWLAADRLSWKLEASMYLRWPVPLSSVVTLVYVDVPCFNLLVVFEWFFTRLTGILVRFLLKFVYYPGQRSLLILQDLTSHIFQPLIGRFWSSLYIDSMSFLGSFGSLSPQIPRVKQKWPIFRLFLTKNQSDPACIITKHSEPTVRD